MENNINERIPDAIFIYFPIRVVMGSLPKI